MSFLAYNENGELQEYESYNGIVKCSHCNKAYRQTVDKSYDICPYCNAVNRSSMEEEYFNSKLQDNESQEEIGNEENVP